MPLHDRRGCCSQLFPELPDGFSFSSHNLCHCMGVVWFFEWTVVRFYRRTAQWIPFVDHMVSVRGWGPLTRCIRLEKSCLRLCMLKLRCKPQFAYMRLELYLCVYHTFTFAQSSNLIYANWGSRFSFSIPLFFETDVSSQGPHPRMGTLWSPKGLRWHLIWGQLTPWGPDTVLSLGCGLPNVWNNYFGWKRYCKCSKKIRYDSA